jgi:hypothetical protein
MSGQGQSPKIAATLDNIGARFAESQLPLVIDKDNRVIYGNVAAMRERGMKRAPMYRCKTLAVGDPAALELREALIGKYGFDS